MQKSLLTAFSMLFGIVLFGQTDSVRTDSLKTKEASDTIRVTYTEQGIASWYGEAFAGRKTSSGEIFCPDSMTCAHKTLPFGSLVRVTNLKNDSVIVVKVTDRLPQNSKRCIDLTSAAAKRLNFLRAGLTTVKLEVIGKAPINKPKPKPKPAPKPVAPKAAPARVPKP
ncbi:MAG: septal ring lytic transglycosylase RlpA family protein [Bacteroidia bacterium]